MNNHGLVGLGGRQVLAAEILGGRRVSIRIDEATLSFFDPSSRELLRVRPTPLTSEEVQRLHGLRPAGPPPGPGWSRSVSSGGSARPARSWSATRSYRRQYP
ncbi:hypothetical protein [Streptomyces sp. Go-475]|uniref:hypothetical protein n=1 Tax=Streptomyces sp. Go-475 TaxID=2072505 RepID=UPI001E29746D|nr:hypothetical protein [Streptomyces sp. Go-475]